MISASLTKDFGVIASDSAQYILDVGKMSFEAPKLSRINGKFLMSFLGSNLYFSNIDKTKFNMDFIGLCLYMESYLNEMRPKVGSMLAEMVKDEDEQKPNFCLFLLGVCRKYPTLAQFNSFKDFKPEIMYCDEGIKFSSLFHGDDTVKNEVFQKSHDFMVDEAKRLNADSPGLVGEVLARGIYKKADLEMEAKGKKYAGGLASCAVIYSDGRIYSLAGLEDIWLS
jgi:hypothetical protein